MRDRIMTRLRRRSAAQDQAEELERNRILLAEWIASRLEPMHADILRAASAEFPQASGVAMGEEVAQVQIDVLSFVAEEIAALRDAMHEVQQDAAASRREIEALRRELRSSGQSA